MGLGTTVRTRLNYHNTSQLLLSSLFGYPLTVLLLYCIYVKSIEGSSHATRVEVDLIGQPVDSPHLTQSAESQRQRRGAAHSVAHTHNLGIWHTRMLSQRTGHSG